MTLKCLKVVHGKNTIAKSSLEGWGGEEEKEEKVGGLTLSDFKPC